MTKTPSGLTPLLFFPRLQKKLISVLLPTRGRPDHLCHAVDSLYSLAADQSLLEVILKIDDDDTATIEMAGRLEKILPAGALKKIISPRGAGYHQMHEWVNSLCAIAEGDWLFLFNDDARMKTEWWDQIILRVGTDDPWLGIEDVCLLVAQTQRRPFTQEFVFLRKQTFDILGHFSLSPHNDNWIHGVCKFLDAALILPIEIEHLSDVIGDRTRIESEEAYKTTIHSLKSLPALSLKMIDVSRLYSHLVWLDGQRQWLNQPEQVGWHWFRAEGQEMEKHYYVDGARDIFIMTRGMAVKQTDEMRTAPGKWSFRY